MNKKLELKRPLKQFGIMLALMLGVVGALASFIGSLYVICVLLGDWVTDLSVAWNMPVFYVIFVLFIQFLGAILGLLLIVCIVRLFWWWADSVLCKIENKRKKKALQ
jgi:ABC-type microcin C transport system permease subunit YejE